MKKILTIVGARPQFIKAAVLSRLFHVHDKMREIMVHTGQHFDPMMSDIFFKELDIPKPHFHLNINTLTHGAMTGRMMEAIEDIVLQQQPDIVLVYGDTNSTLAGALVAAKLHIPVAHVEAGLRSFNHKMPEEINRVLTDHMSTFLFCPTQESITNLQKENITKGVYHTGDIMYDAVLFAREKVDKDVLKTYAIEDSRYALLTLHRQENTDDRSSFCARIDYVKRYAKTHNVKIVWPVHPRLLKMSDKEHDNDFIKIHPLSYDAMQSLLAHCHSVLTDSGGLQKEAYFHQKPCVTLRSETEWGETISAGWNRLWTHETYQTPLKTIHDYGQGDAAQRIMRILETC